MAALKLRRNRPLAPIPDRPAVVVSRTLVGYRDGIPLYEALCICDDLERRTFVSGADGMLRRKP